MRKIVSSLFVLLLVICAVNVQAQVSKNMTLLSNWDDSSLPVTSGLVYNDIWGWYDAAKNREYAIIGSLERTYFIDITDPYNPVVADSVEGGHNNCIHRDYKTYQNYCYAVADEGTGSTLQIIDMSYLPDSVVKVYDSNQFFRRSHNIFIEEGAGRLYAVGCNNQWNGVKILDIATNPANPTILLDSNLGNYSHDIYVKNDTGYLNNGNSGLKVWDFKNAAAPVAIGVLQTYPDKGYNHSCWRTEDGDYLVMCDETHDKAVKVLDVQSLGNMQVTSLMKSTLMAPGSTTSIPHNAFMAGNYAVISYYHDGVQLWDITDPYNPIHNAWYDTDNISTNYGGYNGCWGVYPYLPSGTIIASDTRNGLFVIRPDFPFPYPLLSNLTYQDVACAGKADASATATPQGGTGPYSYLWSTGDTTSFVQNLDTGMYTVQITDVYGNAIIDTFMITQGTPIITSSTVTNATCPGSTNGAIDYSISGGSPPYNFSWSNGASTEDISGLTSGTYIVSVSDSVLCGFSDTIFIGIANNLSSDPGPDTTSCSSIYAMLGSVSLGANGNWKQTFGLNATIADTSDPLTAIDFPIEGAFSFSWTVVSGNCTNVDTVLIVISKTAFTDAGLDSVTCNSNGLLQGNNPSPGTGSWSVITGSGNLSSTTSMNPMVSNLGLGKNYFAWTVTDGNCMVSDTAMIWYQTKPAVGFTYSPINLAVDFTDTTAGAVSWNWDFGDGNTSVVQNPSHTFANAGVYSVCLIAENNCGSDTLCTDITVPVVSIDPVVDGIYFSLFPNPNTGEFFIEGELSKGADLKFELFDLLGRLVLNDNLSVRNGVFRKKIRIDETGIYIARVSSESATFSRQVIIQGE